MKNKFYTVYFGLSLILSAKKLQQKVSPFFLRL